MLLDIEYDDTKKIKVYNLIDYDKDIIKKLKSRTKKLNDKNILLSNFEEDLWIVNEEIVKQNFEFNDFDELAYRCQRQKRKGMYSFNEFKNSVKGYVILLMNKLSIELVHLYLVELKKVIKKTDYFSEEKSKELDFNKLTLPALKSIEGYINFVNFQGIEHYRESIEEQLEYKIKLTSQQNKSRDNRRHLADFQSIFLFDRLLKYFFENGDPEKRHRFWIINIWWNLTGIIPLRLKEFCLTPYDCLDIDNDAGKYYIKLRRSRIKGNSEKKKITHIIDEDYELKKYPINKKMADMISHYQEITKDVRDDDRFLMCYTDYLSSSAPWLVEKTDELLNNTIRASQLRRLYKTFFTQVIQNIYGYEIVEYSDFLKQRNKLSILGIEDEDDETEFEFQPLQTKQITMFRMGDIRHVALINMVLNDINPILVRDFVDHCNINTTFHYFGNVGELVKCMSYTKYEQMCKNKGVLVLNKDDVITSEQIFNRLDAVKSVEVDNGRCISKKFIEGKLDDCMKVDDCDEGCDFFIREKAFSQDEVEQRLKQIEFDIQKESELIGNLLKSYKNNSIINEELSKTALRLQRSARLYCDEVIKNGDIILG